MNLWLPGGIVLGGLEVWDWHIHRAISKVDDPQGPTLITQRILLNILWLLMWEKNLKTIDACIWITESLCCTAETNTVN